MSFNKITLNKISLGITPLCRMTIKGMTLIKMKQSRMIAVKMEINKTKQAK
jgi:hypothetical protein